MFKEITDIQTPDILEQDGDERVTLISCENGGDERLVVKTIIRHDY